MSGTQPEHYGGLFAMRRLAHGVLILLICIYVTTFFVAESGFVVFLRTAAGAGIVGALADWFAVVALFRHPLGLPIPHTALLPRNKDRVAQNIGRFIEEHFLDSAVISERIRSGELIRPLIDLARKSDLVKSLADRLTEAWSWVLSSDLPSAIEPRILDIARRSSLEAAGSERLAKELAHMLQQGARGEGLTQLMTYIRTVVDENRPFTEKLVTERSRWWVHSRVDKQTARVLVASVLSVLDELANPDSGLRKSLEKALQVAIDDLEKNGTLSVFIRDGAGDYLASPAFDSLIKDILNTMAMRSTSAVESGSMQQDIETLLEIAIDRLSSDGALQKELDAGIATFVGEVIEHLRPSIASFVTETILSWDTDVLVKRFETEVGRDLQFIRINGSVLGFVIGGALFLMEHVIL